MLIANCNECINVNLTEHQQHSAPYCEPHICKVYKSRLYHNTNRLGFHKMLYPCKECAIDNFKNFEEGDNQ